MIECDVNVILIPRIFRDGGGAVEAFIYMILSTGLKIGNHV